MSSMDIPSWVDANGYTLVGDVPMEDAGIGIGVTVFYKVETGPNDEFVIHLLAIPNKAEEKT